MRSIMMALLAMGNITIRDIPVKKHETPIIPVPDMHIAFRQDDEYTFLDYDPRIPTEYPLWKGSWLSHPIEITYLICWIEYECRKSLSDSWTSHILALHLNMSDEIGWRSGPYYDLSKSREVTGATSPDYHRYRLVVEVNGFTSNKLTDLQNIHGQFCDRYSSKWVYAYNIGIRHTLLDT